MRSFDSLADNRPSESSQSSNSHHNKPGGICQQGSRKTKEIKDINVTDTNTQAKKLIRIGHSPDADDAFMFYALAKDLIDTGPYRIEHEMCDIDTLNRRAFHGELEMTAVSVHAYAYLNDVYVMCNCGASMGENYGPIVVAREGFEVAKLAGKTVAVPGTMTSAFLALGLYLQVDMIESGKGDASAKGCRYVVVPFDEIIDAVIAGEYNGQKVDAGLLIHEGQLTYQDQGLANIVDLGQWWHEETDGLPLPLGANVVRKDLGGQVIEDIVRIFKRSVEYSLAHREAALEYALSFGRGLEVEKADRFVGMYVNERTLDFGPEGRKAVALFLDRAYRLGIVPKRVVPEFV